jgi:hypothetical protein
VPLQYDLIANDKEEPVTGQDGLRVMQIIEAAIQSSAQKKSNQFIDKVKLLCTYQPINISVMYRAIKQTLPETSSESREALGKRVDLI